MGQPSIKTAKEIWDQEVKNKCRYTKPWLDLKEEDLQDYINRKSTCLPRPYAYCYPRQVFQDITGKNVLCLASGGGQQSAVFGLLGAIVYVLDICEGQLEGDKIAAKHYGYNVNTVQGDMRDLSVFSENSFDLIYQAISFPFIPDVSIVYKEVFRILKAGGLYRTGHVNPSTVAVSFNGPNNGWDGVGYRISEPYSGGPIFQLENGNETLNNGTETGEYVHKFSDIFNLLIETGFQINGVWEDPAGDLTAPKGSEVHMRAFIQHYFAILSEKKL